MSRLGVSPVQKKKKAAKDRVIEVTCEDELDQVFDSAGDRFIIADFGATWCGPCKTLAPHFHTWSTSLPQHVFVSVDVDDAESLARKYNITAVPTVIVFRNGKVYKELEQRTHATILKQLETLSSVSDG